MTSFKYLSGALSIIPGVLALAAAMAPIPGYGLGTYLASVACILVLITSYLMRSDGLYLVALSLGASVLGLTAASDGLELSFAVVIALLVLFDVVRLAKSLFGILRPMVDPTDSVTIGRYLAMVRGQVARSSGVGLASYIIAMSAVSTPLPLVSFTNPVSGSGILALVALLLVVLATFDSPEGKSGRANSEAAKEVSWLGRDRIGTLRKDPAD